MLDVLGLLVFFNQVRAYCLCPAVQCLYHHRFVGQWVVGHEVEIVVWVGGFPVYSC